MGFNYFDYYPDCQFNQGHWDYNWVLYSIVMDYLVDHSNYTVTKVDKDLWVMFQANSKDFSIDWTKVNYFNIDHILLNKDTTDINFISCKDKDFEDTINFVDYFDRGSYIDFDRYFDKDLFELVPTIFLVLPVFSILLVFSVLIIFSVLVIFPVLIIFSILPTSLILLIFEAILFPSF